MRQAHVSLPEPPELPLASSATLNRPFFGTFPYRALPDFLYQLACFILASVMPSGPAT